MDEKQNEAVQLAHQGHNLFLTGGPGTGKTFTLGEIVERLQFSEKKVCLTGSTGKAASVLKENLHVPDQTVSTIHRLCGLMDGRYQNSELLSLLLNNETFERQRHNILTADTVVIDEISMISCKTFNQIEYIFRNVRNTDKPFGGIHMILAGDLAQLPPVPNSDYGDDGSLFIQSNVMENFHIIKLINVQRQEELDYIQAIHDVASGNLTIESENLIHRLQRTLPPGDEPVKLFSLNFDVDLWNARRLGELNGVEKVYSANEDGDVKKCAGAKELHIKEGCPVMLIVNLSDELVNGLTGKVTGTTQDTITVSFPSAKVEMPLKRFAFPNYSAALKKDVGCRLQFPLKLAYAMTIHKAQGMTMDRVSLDCKGMFEYGQLAVGLSRARLKKGLQILNFSRKLLRQPPAFITDFFQRHNLIPNDSLSCCRNKSDFFSVHIQQQTTECTVSFECQEDFDSDIEQEIIEAVQDIEHDLERENPEFKYPISIEFDQEKMQTLHYQTPETDQQKFENRTLAFLVEHELETHNYSQFVWEKFNTLIDSSLLNEQNITNKTLTNFYKECNRFLTSEENKVKARHLFGHNPTENEYNLIYRLTSVIRKEILKNKAEPIRKEAIEKAKKEKGKTFIESSGGLGKIRYIAGWVVFKLKRKRKKQIVSTMYDRKKVKITEKLVREKEILEHIEASAQQLYESANKETLEATERKQNIRRGLTNVNDNCAIFFQELDMKIRKIQTCANLNIHGKNFSTFVNSQLKNDKELFTKWTELFKNFPKQVDTDIFHTILDEIVDRYTLMSIAQLRKEYLAKKHAKKLEATRKQIKMRTDTKKHDPCTIATIKMDKYADKIASHRRLQSEILNSETFLETNFKKTEMILLCQAYNVKGYKSVIVKKSIAEILKPAILDSQFMINFKAVCETEHEASTSAKESTEKTVTELDTEQERPEIEQSSTTTKTVHSTEQKKTVASKGKKRKSVGKGKGKGKKSKGPNKWPCGICKEDASHNSVGCDRCDTWFHADCLKIDDLNSLGDEWYCQLCKDEMEQESN